MGEQWCDTVCAVVDFEELCQTGLTDVKTHKYHLLVQKGEAHCQVGAVERLTLTGSGGGEHYHLIALLHHELDVGTHRAEYFLHLVVLVLVNHDVRLRLGSVARHSHIGKDRQFGEFCYFVVTFYAVAEEVQEEVLLVSMNLIS